MPTLASQTRAVQFLKRNVTLKELDSSVSAPMINHQSTTHADEIHALMIPVKVAKLVTKFKARF